MSYANTLPRASFDGLEFLTTSRSAKGEFRHHPHEFIKAGGASVEKQGRKTWLFSFQSPFHTTFGIPDLYPDRLEQFQQRFEDGITAPLLIPEIGTIRAFITRFERGRQGRVRSGEDVSMEFIEDDLQPFRNPTTGFAQSQLASAGATIAQTLTDARSDLEARIPGITPRIDGMLSLLDTITALRDQQSLYGLQVAGKLAQLTSLNREVHELLKGPDLDPLRRSLRDVWLSAKQIAVDVKGKDDGEITPFIVPQTTSVGQIAQRLYRDTSRGGEVLSLNSRVISDPYAVRAGTRLTVYAA